MKPSINSIFVHIDKTFAQMKKRAEELNGKNKFAVSFTHRVDYDPEGKPYKISEINPLFYETTEKDHNKNFQVFLFRTMNKYRNTSPSYRDVILKNSELKKVFYKDKSIEVGLTIEPTLQNPTDTCWGYSFRGYRYYIIKDGVETITQSRSVIRKIYNNKPNKNEILNIRFENDVTWYTREILEIKELYTGVYFLSTDNEDFYLCDDEDNLWKYILDKIITKEEWVIELGGVDNILEMVLSGSNFDPLGYLKFNKEVSEFLPIEKPLNRDRINFTSLDIDSNTNLSGYDVYYVTK